MSRAALASIVLSLAGAGALANNIAIDVTADPPSNASAYVPGEIVRVAVRLRDETTDVNSLELVQVDLRLTNATLVPQFDPNDGFTDPVIFGGATGSGQGPTTGDPPQTWDPYPGPLLPGCPGNCLIGAVPSQSGGGTIYFWLRTSTQTAHLFNPPPPPPPGRLFIQFKIQFTAACTVTVDALGPCLDDQAQSGALAAQAGTGTLWANCDPSADPNNANNFVGGILNLTVDATPPTITACAPNQNLSANAGCQAVVPNLTGQVTATDNCTPSGSLTITQSPPAGTLIGLGATNVTITVRDTSNNASTCIATVTVVDTTPPTITVCAPNQNLSANANCQAVVPNLTGQVTANDNCTPSGSLTITQSPAAGTLIGLGATSVTITVRDASNNASTCMATLTVVDGTAPTIGQCAGNVTLFADASCNASVPDLTGLVMASDNCTPSGVLSVMQSPAAGTGITLGDTVVTLTVSDAAGNSTTCQATVTVTDNMSRVISQCAPDQTLSADANCQAALPNLGALVVASDNCAGLTVSQSPAPGTLVGLGTTDVTITVTDSSSNASNCTATITVVDSTNPSISDCAPDQTVAGDANCQATVPDFTASVVAVDNCTNPSSITQTPAAGTLAACGSHPIVLTVTDAAGNSADCTATLTVTSTLPGDCDGDGDVDLADYANLPACLSGPAAAHGPNCGCFDRDSDADVDLLDFADFQAFFSGS
jgi:hypothetical protein